jgi:serine protein kinase
VKPIYALAGSPVNESPLGLFTAEYYGDALESDYGIPRRYLTGIMSPWAIKRLREFGGDISKFRVARIQPSVLRQVAIAKTEPGDENNQDISSLMPTAIRAACASPTRACSSSSRCSRRRSRCCIRC